MGNKPQSTSRGSSTSLEDFSEIKLSKSRSKEDKNNLLLQQNLQATRQHMIDAWIELLLKTLKKKGSQQKDWAKTCDKISAVIQQFTPSQYWKVFSVTDSLGSKDSIQMRANELNKDERKKLQLRRANSIVIDIKAFGKKMAKRVKQRPESHMLPELVEIKQLKKNIGIILEYQFNQDYHPFSSIKRIFIEDLAKKYENLTPLQKLEEDTAALESLANDFGAIVLFILKGCQIYKEWIQYFTNLKEKGYNRLMSKTIINSLFDPPSNLHSILYKAISIVNSKYISSIAVNLRQNVNIGKFTIRKQLEIQGNYIKSMIMLSEIDKISHPKKLIRFFETLKTQIESDIQFFNETFGKLQQSTIDGDNLLSILCYMLCKMKAKLGDIHTQLMLLHVVYGQNILIDHDTASYMITAMSAAIDYLRSEEFVDILRQ